MLGSNNKTSLGSMIVSILFVGLFLYGLFYLVGGIFKLLTFAAPALLIVALIFDYKTVLDYGKKLVNLTQKNFIQGVGAIALSILLYPLVFAYLLAKAYFKKYGPTIDDSVYQEGKQETIGEFIEYEVIEDLPLNQKTKVKPKRNQ